MYLGNMNNDQGDRIWQPLAKALFGSHKTTDGGLFTFRVMEQVRRLEPVLQDMAWHRFLRWAVPMLGAGVAGLVLAASSPSASSLMDTALFHQRSNATGTLSAALQEE